MQRRLRGAAETKIGCSSAAADHRRSNEDDERCDPARTNLVFPHQNRRWQCARTRRAGTLPTLFLANDGTPAAHLAARVLLPDTGRSKTVLPVRLDSR